MGATVNNGVNIGGHTLLATAVPAPRSLKRSVREIVLSVLMTADMEQREWLVTVRSPTGEAITTRRFPQKRLAEQARAELAAEATAAANLDAFDWSSVLAGL